MAEVAYAFASKALIENANKEICLAFYTSFARFVKDAIKDGPTSGSLLWEALSNLSSKHMGDQNLVRELLKMRFIVVTQSGLRLKTLKSRLPLLFHL